MVVVSAFSGLTRGEEHAGFIVLNKFGVTEDDWRRMTNDEAVVKQVAKALCLTEKIVYSTLDLEARFAACDQSNGRVLESRPIQRAMSFGEMKAEFQPEIVSEADVLATIRSGALRRDQWGIFFLTDCVLDVRWRGGGLDVRASPVEHPYGWVAGDRVFSRNFGA